MERSFSKLKEESELIDLPDECEENDRAVRFLALETGVGHYDDLNLLVLAVLIMFISVAFIAVNGGKITEEDEFSFSMKTFLSGEFTSGLEEKYIENLPITDEIKSMEDRVSLLYGFGNTLSDRGDADRNPGIANNQFGNDFNIFDQDENEGLSENAVTTKVVQTDKDGNTVTEADSVETVPGGGTTAVARPPMTKSTTTTTTKTETTTTTNNSAPSATTTTTVVTSHTTTTSQTTTTTTTTPTETEPTTTTTTTTSAEPSETQPPAAAEPS